MILYIVLFVNFVTRLSLSLLRPHLEHPEADKSPYAEHGVPCDVADDEITDTHHQHGQAGLQVHHQGSQLTAHLNHVGPACERGVVGVSDWTCWRRC